MNVKGIEAMYIRCSTDEQEPELQIRDIISYANSPHQIEIRKENLSAWDESVNRPVFSQLEKDILRGKIAVLYVWHLDRISRNRKRLISFFRLCKSKNVIVKSYSQQWLSTIADMPEPFNEVCMDFFLQILGWMAETESTTKSQRIKMATRKQKDCTYSYKGNKWGRKSFPTNTVNRVLDLYKEGFSIRRIAEKVKVYDKNNNGRNISKSAVHKLILVHKAEKHS